MSFEIRQLFFYALVLTGFVACLWLKFVAGGVLRGNLYDLLLVFVIASATFSTLNLWLVKEAAEETRPGELRRRQSKLSLSCIAIWAAIAVGAELVQGLLMVATGEDVMGRFDPVDLASYLAGAILSFIVNPLLYRTTITRKVRDHSPTRHAAK